MIYVPESQPVLVRDLGTNTYTVTYFDPVSGRKSTFKIVRSDNNGRWTSAQPEGNDHDWVVILENRRNKP